MSSQAQLLPQAPLIEAEAELRAALQSVAIPGYTGSLHVEIGLQVDAACDAGLRRYYVVMAVLRRESKRVGEDLPAAGARQLLPDVERRKPVERVLSAVRPKLFVRPILQAVEVHVKDGVVQPNFTIQE